MPTRSTMADRHVILKNACKEIAWAQGKAITFMAKWDYGARRLFEPYPQVAVVERAARPLFHDAKARARHVGR